MASKTKTRVKFAVSGIEGSYSEDAAELYIHTHSISAKFIHTITIPNTLEAVYKGEAELGIVPLKNSHSGTVAGASEALKKYPHQPLETFSVSIHHCLLALPGVKLSDIDQVVSHPQGIKQCKDFLHKTLPQAKLVEYANTALAAKDLSAGKLPINSAVIASRKAAQLFHLHILLKDIQDSSDNATHFMVFSRG